MTCRTPVWVPNLVTLGGYQHRSHREELALPLEAYSPPAWWSTMYVNSSGHEDGNSYSVLAVILSAAKDLFVRLARPFAALRVTGLLSQCLLNSYGLCSLRNMTFR